MSGFYRSRNSVQFKQSDRFLVVNYFAIMPLPNTSFFDCGVGMVSSTEIYSLICVLSVPEVPNTMLQVFSALFDCPERH